MTTSRRPALASVVLGAAIAVAAAGCGSSSSTATATTAAPPAGAAPAGAPITAGLTEFAIALSRNALTPGTYTFVVSNGGSTLHALKIDGPSGSVLSTALLTPGQSATMTATLRAGTYQVYCPVANHRQMGMHATLTVAGTPASGAPASSSSGGY